MNAMTFIFMYFFIIYSKYKRLYYTRQVQMILYFINLFHVPRNSEDILFVSLHTQETLMFLLTSRVAD